MIMQIAEYVAWFISAALGLWMVVDAVKVSREHPEEFLTTSVEGTDELLTPPTTPQTSSRTSEGTTR